MGYDDGACEQSPDGEHEFVLRELVPGKKAGLALVSVCGRCEAVSYEASAADDPRREA